MKTALREVSPFILLTLIFTFMVTFKEVDTLTDLERTSIEEQQLIIEQQAEQTPSDLDTAKSTFKVTN
ncbi:hypothetical protein [Bacillus sp. es.036]|uniref:hypothetical protein n=1 Tax=Bacillus sp. es.036 TaxID=1761764 RepID=UPI000C006289|nr:hypothetical protein [Bacillus sp. es.036]PFG15074.1 hypothetical protein ATG70_3321 [Bacillus sp. es.036]